MNKVNRFIKTLGELRLTVAFAESITCGMATANLAAYKGASDVLAGSVVCYTPAVKMNLLKVSKAMIDRYSCESAQVTKALANGSTKIISADIHAALTGLASAGGSETRNKPVGTVFYCIRYKKKFHSFRFQHKGTPLEIRKKACDKLYQLILMIVNSHHQ